MFNSFLPHSKNRKLFQELVEHLAISAARKVRENQFQFGYVCGSFAWSAENDYVDTLWEGNDEMDPAHGSIYCEIENGELHGTIGFFNGDESAFRAVREKK